MLSPMLNLTSGDSVFLRHVCWGTLIATRLGVELDVGFHSNLFFTHFAIFISPIRTTFISNKAEDIIIVRGTKFCFVIIEAIGGGKSKQRLKQWNRVGGRRVLQLYMFWGTVIHRDISLRTPNPLTVPIHGNMVEKLKLFASHPQGLEASVGTSFFHSDT